MSEPCLIPGCTEPGEHELTSSWDNSLGRVTVTVNGRLCTSHRQQYFPVEAGDYSIREGQNPPKTT